MRLRPTALIPVTLATAAAVVLGTAAPALADDPAAPTTLTLSAPTTLTLPATDGIRDSSTVTVAADAPTTVTLTVVAADDTVVATLPAVELTADALSVDVPVALSALEGVAAGDYELDAATSDATPLTAAQPLVVGSGAATAVSVTLGKTLLFPWSGSGLNSTSARVAAVDETGLNVPFHGAITTTIGSKKITNSITTSAAASAAITLSVKNLPTGTAHVVARVAGATGAAVSSSTRSVTLRAVSIASTAISASATSVYPHKDGYRDSVALTVSATSTTAKAIPVTGSVTISRAGRTVTSWKLTSSTTKRITWNGLNHGAVVAGTYTVKVAIKGPQGSTHTASKNITVSAKRVVSKTSSKWVSAYSILKKYTALDEYQESYCSYSATNQFGCTGYDLYYSDSYSVIGNGSIAVPSAVKAGAAIGTSKVRMTLDVSYLDGSGQWQYVPSSQSNGLQGALHSGQSSLGWKNLTSKDTSVDLYVGLGAYTDLIVDRVKVEWSYKALV